MTLYYAFCSLGPFILLAVAKGAFGPWNDDAEDWSYAYLGDALAVLMIVGGGIVSLLVLGEVITATSTTRLFVVVAGILSLLLLATHMLWEVGALYRTGQRSHDG